MIHGNVELHNVEDAVRRPGAEGASLCRYPERVRALLDDPAVEAPFFCAGAEIRFNIRSGKARFLLARDAAAPVNEIGIAEIWFGSFQGDWRVSPRFVDPEGTWIEVSMPSDVEALVRAAEASGSPWDPRLVRLVLPYDYVCRLVRIEGDLEPPRPGQCPPRRFLAYGSSITHGGTAVRPTETWAMRVAQALGIDLVNLGLAGNCRLEPGIAEWIAERRDWAFATLELGINLIDRMEAPEFAARADRFLRILGRARPEAQIFCIDLFTNGRDLAGDDRIAAYRNAVRDAVASSGSDRIVYVNGKDFLDPAIGLCEGLLHPSSRGHEEIARKLAVIIRAERF